MHQLSRRKQNRLQEQLQMKMWTDKIKKLCNSAQVHIIQFQVQE